ncbi:MAG TPA: hypothetical protein VHV80_03615 [Steroidobacteraceae bacterium]|nr:hypothetical protein [Steroidobacteraceae bacterium]
MIQLTFHEPSGAPAAMLEATDIRITGGVLWNQLEHGLIACFACNAWKHRGAYYPSLSIAGACCLAFGIARETLISEPISLFSMTGTTFRANGVAVAEYDEKLDLWQGLIRPITWQAMRVVSAAAASALVDSTRAPLLNPWDYPGSASASAIFSSKYTT